MAAGVSAAGLQIKTLLEIFAEIEQDVLSNVDSELDTSEDAAIGQLLRIASGHLAQGWELLDVAYNAFNEENAQGILLENIAALTGTYRESATRGTVTINCTLAAGTTLATTATVGHASDDTNRWTLRTAFTAPSTGVHALVFVAQNPGNVSALAGTLTVIKTPVAGWSAATNPTDANPGRALETIEALRLRRREELPAQGSTNTDAIHAAVGNVPGVRTVRIFENTTNSFSSEGLPPKSFEVVFWDGATRDASDLAVAAAIYKNKAAGIEAHGAVKQYITDKSGRSVSIGISRVVQVHIHVYISVATDSRTFPGGGETLIRQAILDYGASLGVGDNVFRMAVMSAALKVPGVKDVADCEINGDYANIAIGDRQIASFNSANIIIDFFEAAK